MTTFNTTKFEGQKCEPGDVFVLQTSVRTGSMDTTVLAVAVAVSGKDKYGNALMVLVEEGGQPNPQGRLATISQYMASCFIGNDPALLERATASISLAEMWRGKGK